VHLVVRVPAQSLHGASDPASRLQEIAFAGERPPRQAPTEACHEPARDTALPHALDGERSTARTNQPSRERQLLARAVPSAPIPHTHGRAVCRQIELAVDSTKSLSHAAQLMQFRGHIALNLS
jgi:hypothetical protein